MPSIQGVSAAILALALTMSPALAKNTVKPLSPVGTWQMVTGESRFKVTFCGQANEVCAQLVWLREDARTADNLVYLNQYVLRGARPAVTNKWRGEADYQGEMVKGTMTMVDADTMTLNGCKGALCKKFELIRR